MHLPGRFHRNRFDRPFHIQRARPKCSVVQFLELMFQDRGGSYAGTGRQIGECELHLDGNLIFQGFAIVGAGLAYLTYLAIQARGRRRKRAVNLLSPTQIFQLGSNSTLVTVTEKDCL